MTDKLTIYAHGMSHIGNVRKTNEDNFLCDDELGFWAVADGMGGHDAGEIASDIAVTRMHQGISHHRPADEPEIRELVTIANRAIYEYGLDHQLPNGLGTTLTSVLREDNELWVAHVGDSRLLRVRGGKVFQLTTDHSWVQHQIDLGELTEEEAAKHPMRNVIMRSMGYDADVLPDVFKITVEPGDLLLLASDGLTNKVKSQEAANIMSQEQDPEESLQQMIDLALQRGGEDNITAVIITIA